MAYFRIRGAVVQIQIAKPCFLNKVPLFCISRNLGLLLKLQKEKGIIDVASQNQQRQCLNKIKGAISVTAKRFSGHQQHVSAKKLTCASLIFARLSFFWSLCRDVTFLCKVAIFQHNTIIVYFRMLMSF